MKPNNHFVILANNTLKKQVEISYILSIGYKFKQINGRSLRELYLSHMRKGILSGTCSYPAG